MKKKKKMNRKGFTLIELLAVITIMGILMMVAIPNVSRTIENARKDTFVDLAKQYIDAIRTAVIADELECGEKTSNSDNTSMKKISALGNGTYYFPITFYNLYNQPSSVGYKYVPKQQSTNNMTGAQTTSLMEKGGKSPWGQANVIGVVAWEKSGGKDTYYIFLVDYRYHGINTLVSEANLSRTKVVSNTNVRILNSSADSSDGLLEIESPRYAKTLRDRINSYGGDVDLSSAIRCQLL